MAKWILAEDGPTDEWVHHKCSSCNTLALFNYLYAEDFDESIDGEWYSLGLKETGMSEHITQYCPNCGEKMDCSEALHRINGCMACIHYDETNCDFTYGFTEKCVSCGDYPWAKDKLPSKWEMKGQ